jgi:hypothetical protein
MQTDSVAGVGELELANVALTAARSASVSSRRPRKVSGTKMLCKPKEFGRDYKKPTFPSSSPLTPATQSVSEGAGTSEIERVSILTSLQIWIVTLVNYPPLTLRTSHSLGSCFCAAQNSPGSPYSAFRHSPAEEF